MVAVLTEGGTMCNPMTAADRLLSLICANPDLSLSGPGCPADTLLAAEGELGVTLPPSYRKLVQEFGSWCIAGEEFLGLGPEPGPGQIVYETTRARRELGLPTEMVVVQFDGMGGHIVLDTAEVNGEGECPVRAWTGALGVQAIVEDLAPSFGEYALEACESAVRDWRESDDNPVRSPQPRQTDPPSGAAGF